MVVLEEAENLVQSGDYYGTNKETLVRKFDIPIHHLDFAYVEQCKDGTELEKIFQILKSGEEGYFPDLLCATEKRLAEVKPKSRYIRKLTPVLSKSELGKDELQEISHDLNVWLEDVKRNNEELKSAKNLDFGGKRGTPEIRKTRELANEVSEKAAKRIASTDYESWNKFDAETAILKMDLEDEKLRKQAEQAEKKPKTEKAVRFNRFSTKAEALFEANHEKEKGNECFKASEYENALEHYGNSISYFPSATLYTNRAITYIKLKNYENAISDCEEALKFEPRNVKANLRMAQSYQALNKPNDALFYAEKVIEINPNNTSAQQIAEKERQLCGQNTSRNVRFKIVETESAKTKPKHSILKNAKTTDSEVIPIPGTSKMKSPYFKTINSNNPKVIKSEKQAIINRPQPMFLTSLDIISDDENECVEQHLKVGDNCEEDERVYLKIGMGKNYEVVDNRYCTSVKRRGNDNKNTLGKITSKSKSGKNSKIKNKTKQSKTIEDAKKEKGKLVQDVTGLKLITIKDVNRSEQGTSHGGIEDDTRNLRRQENVDHRNIRPVECETGGDDDIRGGGEPHIEKQITHASEIPSEIHLPYTFVKTWQSVWRDGSYLGFASVIRKINMERMPEVIGNKIDATILSDMINCLYRHFTVVGEVEKVYSALVNLCRVQRFGIAIMFLSENDKILIQNLVEFLKQHGRVLSDDIKVNYGLKL